ncbi:MAG: glucosamine-6-phosphate deaminase [Lachnospiraceae bacterium]|nr:glucosamine-6-phosphate deaminase [Lachnospiraceae bacterium]
MRVYRTKDYDSMSRRAADIIAAQIVLKPESVLGLATGTTPIGTYTNLRKLNKQGVISFAEVQTFNLDEYVGLDGTDPNSYRYFMNTNLFDHVDIDKSNTHIEDGTTKSPARECKRYDKMIRQMGGVDLQLLGIGNNGHIGFCEPAESFSKGTHVEQLTQSTIEANSRLFERIEDVPTSALTMGIGTIMSAHKILLIASGKAKAEAIRATLYGPVTPKVPASVLQLHQDVTVIADKAALALCESESDRWVIE